MNVRKIGLGLLGAAVLAVPVMTSGASAESVFMPLPTYRTGPYSVNGIPTANGYVDYMAMLNARDGGVEGVTIEVEECEFGYKTDKGVECYERFKSKKPISYNPFSTDVTYKLIPKARVDEVVIFSMGYGMSAAADGRWFPYTFNFPTTYWSQASAFIRYIAEQEGGFDKLKGKKVGLIYLESGYGREPIPVFKQLGEQYGYTFETYSVPGKEMQKQQAQWQKIQESKPDWMFMWGWGVMNRTAIQRASEVGFPIDRFIGVWWSGADADTQPLGELAKGYRAGTFHATGAEFPFHKDIIKHVYDKGNGTDRNSVGQVLYNRGVLNAMYLAEALRGAIKKFGPKITGKELRWGMENLDLTEERLAELGMSGFVLPIKISCWDHEGNGPVMMQEWNGSSWNIIQKGIPPIRELVRPIIEATAVKEAEKLGYEMRKDCEKPS